MDREGSTNLLEVSDFEPLVVQKDLDVLNSPSHIVDTLHQKRVRVIVDTLHAEALEIRCKGDLGILLAFLVLCDLLVDLASCIGDQNVHTLGVPFLLILSEKTCLYFLPFTLSAVSTTDSRQPSERRS